MEEVCKSLGEGLEHSVGAPLSLPMFLPMLSPTHISTVVKEWRQN